MLTVMKRMEFHSYIFNHFHTWKIIDGQKKSTINI